ncbi:hypothetical protein IWX49DRAFT_556386 [Phyllosticta citricarpa]
MTRARLSLSLSLPIHPHAIASHCSGFTYRAHIHNQQRTLIYCLAPAPLQPASPLTNPVYLFLVHPSQSSPRHCPAAALLPPPALHTRLLRPKQKTPCACASASASRNTLAIAPDTVATAQSLPRLQTARL